MSKSVKRVSIDRGVTMNFVPSVSSERCDRLSVISLRLWIPALVTVVSRWKIVCDANRSRTWSCSDFVVGCCDCRCDCRCDDVYLFDLGRDRDRVGRDGRDDRRRSASCRYTVGDDRMTVDCGTATEDASENCCPAAMYRFFDAYFGPACDGERPRGMRNRTRLIGDGAPSNLMSIVVVVVRDCC